MVSISSKQLLEIEKAIILSEKDRESIKKDMEELKEMNKILNWKFDMIIERFSKLDVIFAKKTSVDRLWNIVWSVIGFVFVWAGGAFLSLIFIQH